MKLHPDFSEEIISARHVNIFCQNLGITAYALENHLNFFKKILFNNGCILEINNYCNRSREHVSFTELSEIINILSNQDFAGLDKFRLS